MTKRTPIQDELDGLGSLLADHTPQNSYSVPDGYFEGLADQILLKVKKITSEISQDSILNSISNMPPFTVPSGYFNGLEERLMDGIRKHPDYQTSREEIAQLSPLLENMSREMPYEAPHKYFENLSAQKEKKETKVVSMSFRRTWIRYAAAAVMVGVVAVSALMMIKPNGLDPKENPQAWVKKNVTKKIDSEKLDAFVSLTAEDQNLKTTVANPAVTTAEIRELMKDVSEKEIQDFLNETVVLESYNTDDILLN